jgi:glutaconate CoA-transferase, subunit A
MSEMPTLRSGYPPILSLDELAGYVGNGQRIGVGGALFYRLPMALVQAIIRQGRRDLEYVGWSGGIPLELMLAAGSVSRIKFCFSSLDLFGLAPLFRKALEEKTVEAEDWTAISLIAALRAGQAGFSSALIEKAPGSEVYDRSGYTRQITNPGSKESLTLARALPLDVSLVHASRADEDGNIEILGSQHLDLSLMGAARRTLFTVEEIVPRGKLSGAKSSLIWPRKLVGGIAVVPSGAYPTSSPGYYSTDYREIARASSTVPFQVQSPTEERVRYLHKADRVAAQGVTAQELKKYRVEASVEGPARMEEIMIFWLAQQLDHESICAVGAVSPLAYTAYLLAKRTHAKGLTILPVNAGCVDVPVRPMVLSLAEVLDTQNALFWQGGDTAWDRFYVNARLTHEVVSSAQIDAYGRSNTIEIKTKDKMIRLPGQGGMAEVADLGQHLVFYLSRHSRRNLVEKVDCSAVARTYLTDEERLAKGLKPGTVKLITDLGVFEVNHKTRRFELVMIHPGVSVEKIREETGFSFEVKFPLPLTPVPDAAELNILREEIDPLSIRFLESVSSKERAGLLQAILKAEEDWVESYPDV